MRNLTRYLLWAYVFTVPWDNFALPLVGTVSRAFGLAVVGATVVTIAVNGRVRRPDGVLGFALAFAAWSVLSLLWTLAYDHTVRLVTTYAQSAASVWVIRELVRTREEVEPLLVAFLLGLFVPLGSVLNNFRLGAGSAGDAGRYTGVDLNADLVGLLLVFGVPIAWHLVMRRRGIVRVAALIYFAAAPVALMLTATRGALVAGLAGAAIIPITLLRQSSLRSYAFAGVLLIVGPLAALQVVPTYNWERMGSTVGEVSGDGDPSGTMLGRMRLWGYGLQSFPQRPLLGFGAGAYGVAVDRNIRSNGRYMNPHNVWVGLLVEEGIIGLLLFAGIFGASAWTIFRSPPPYGALWAVLLLTWMVGGMSGNPETQKFTWVLFGLVSSQSGVAKTVMALARQRRAYRSGSNATGTTEHGPNAAGVAPQAAAIQ
jgi:O-antigen ligase